MSPGGDLDALKKILKESNADISAAEPTRYSDCYQFSVEMSQLQTL